MGWGNSKSDQNALEQVDFVSLIVIGHNIDSFSRKVGLLLLKVALCGTLLAVGVPHCAVCHPWELGQDYHVILCNSGLWYGRIAGSEMDLVSVLSLAIISILWKNLSKTINKGTFYLSFLETQSVVETPPSIFLFSSRLITTALENFECIWNVETSLFVLLCVLSGFQVLCKNKQLFKNTTQWSALKPDSYQWQGVWDSMGKCQRLWALPMFQNFIPEQVQNLEKLVKCLEKVCCHLAISETQKSLQSAGLWLKPSKPCWTIFVALKGRKRSLDQTTKQRPPWQALQLNQRTSLCPYTQEEMEPLLLVKEE